MGQERLRGRAAVLHAGLGVAPERAARGSGGPLLLRARQRGLHPQRLSRPRSRPAA